MLECRRLAPRNIPATYPTADFTMMVEIETLRPLPLDHRIFAARIACRNAEKVRPHGATASFSVGQSPGL
jgi:hypothetical protein